MDNKIKLFIELAALFNSHGFQLYLVGGSTRDYLLNLPLVDMDLVSDATPNDVKLFLDNGNYTFERFGSVKFKYKDVKFELTTFRKEGGYVDSRHPNVVLFTKDIKEDYPRRDITINALYLDKNLNVLDFVNGQKDLKNKVIRMVGDPLTRIKEDPLRIIRIYRFSLDLGFSIEPKLETIINQNANLLINLRKEKILEEIHKCHHRNELIQILKKFDINNL